MLTVLARSFIRPPIGRWFRIWVLIGCLALPGCPQFNLRGDTFPEDDLSRMSRQLRPHDTDTEPAGIGSGKASQIAAHLGFN